METRGLPTRARVLAAADGDRAAEEEVLRALLPCIQTSVARVLGRRASRAEVLDRTQDVVVKLLDKNRQRLRAWDPGRGSKYIKTIARRVVLSALRLKAPLVGSSEVLCLDDLGSEQETDARTPEEEVARAQFQAALLDGLDDELSDQERAVFRLLREGLSGREVCAKTGLLTDNAVHQAHRRIKEKAQLVAQDLLREPPRRPVK